MHAMVSIARQSRYLYLCHERWIPCAAIKENSYREELLRNAADFSTAHRRLYEDTQVTKDNRV
jgi:hypothetical protein